MGSKRKETLVRNERRVNEAREPTRVGAKVEAQRGTQRGTWATYAVCTRAWRTSASSVAGSKEATERRFLIHEEGLDPSV